MVASGANRTFTIVPDTGYCIIDVLVDGYSVGAVSSYAFTNVVANHTIKANFITQSAGRPHYKRIGPNLVTNPHIIGQMEWHFYNGAYDPSVSRDSNGGSISFGPLGTAPYFVVGSDLIPVTYGKEYTFAAYMKTDVWPNIGSLMLREYDAQGNFIQNVSGSRVATTGPDIWQEIAQVYMPSSANVTQVSLYVVREGTSPHLDGNLWFDDIYFGEGSFQQPPSSKKPFNVPR